jgi:hypothetical protein
VSIHLRQGIRQATGERLKPCDKKAENVAEQWCPGRCVVEGTDNLTHANLARIVSVRLSTKLHRFIHISRKAREKLSNTGFMMYSKNVRSPVLM